MNDGSRAAWAPPEMLPKDPVQPPVPPPEVVEERSSPLPLVMLVLGAVALGARNPWLLLAIVALIITIALHELGHFLTAKMSGMKVTEAFLGFGPRLWSFRRGETEYGLKAIPLGAYVRVIGMNSLDPLVDPSEENRTYRSASYPRRVLMASAGSLMHFLLAFLAGVWLVGAYGEYTQSSWQIAGVVTDSPAAAAGLQPGDRIVSVNGVPTPHLDQVIPAIRSRPGEQVSLGVNRGTSQLTIPATVGSDCRIGIANTLVPVDRSLAGSAAIAGKTLVTGIGDTAVGIGKLFSPSGISGYIDTIANRPSDNSGSSGTCATAATAGRPSSIIGITQGVADAAQSGLADLLWIYVALNIAIGVFNLFPMLPFDGGHVVIATYERLREIGRPRGERYHADVARLLPVVYGVLAVMLMLFLSAGYLDITRGIN